MKNFDISKLRKFATPITIGGFFLMAVTGILMFFHADMALNKLAHEWLGFAFVAGGLLHLTAHYRSFFKYFLNVKTASLIAIFLVLLFGSFFAIIEQTPNPSRAVMKNVFNKPIAALIPLTGKSQKEVIDNLSAHGFVVGDVAQDSVNSVTRGDVKKNKEMVNLIFQN